LANSNAIFMNEIESSSKRQPGILRKAGLAPDPFEQFRRWLAEAQAAGLYEPLAMTLATANADGQPSARMVLLRGFDQRGFTFFTNYRSRKAGELAINPRAALVFWWGILERQVRIEGRIELVSADESDVYFASRPEGSRLGAWASPQSQVIPDREFLVRRMEEFTAQFPNGCVPRPPQWGGYRLVPENLEFWQGQPNRLHDRLRYRRASESQWLIERLAP
jgi:pyridoxamine 5'-phosphate oxidase